MQLSSTGTTQAALSRFHLYQFGRPHLSGAQLRGVQDKSLPAHLPFFAPAPIHAPIGSLALPVLISYLSLSQVSAFCPAYRHEASCCRCRLAGRLGRTCQRSRSVAISKVHRWSIYHHRLRQMGGMCAVCLYVFCCSTRPTSYNHAMSGLTARGTNDLG